MRNYLLLIALLLTGATIQAQTVPSSCTAPANIVQKYIDDADLLAQRRMLQTNYTDSVVIPQSWTDTSLRALIAIYNATSLPARDSVVVFREIHNSVDTAFIKYIVVVADSGANYMVQLKNNNIPTGVAQFDDLMNQYQLKKFAYIPFVQQIPNAHAVLITSDSNYNMEALVDSFEAIPGVFTATTTLVGISVDSMAVADTVHPTYVAVDFRYSWNCALDCQNHHIWHFRVSYNCDVTYIGSSGDPVPVSVKVFGKAIPKAYPNPAAEALHFVGIGRNTTYSIYDMLGRQLQTGTTSGKPVPVSGLPAGTYYIRLQNEDINTGLKFQKQ